MSFPEAGEDVSNRHGIVPVFPHIVEFVPGVVEH